jgi:hypothetical protein
MTNPITESPSVETINPAVADASPAPEGMSSDKTDSAEVAVPPTHVSDLPATEDSEESKPQSDETADQERLPMPGDQLEEQPPSGSAAGHLQTSARGSYFDIRVGRNDGGRVIGQLFEAVQRHSGAELSKEWVENELKNYMPIGNETELLNLLRDNRVLVIHAKKTGSGRWTAALRLLSTIPGPQLIIRRIRRESGGNFDITGLRDRRGTGWILDLRASDESIPETADLGHELHQASDLRADGSYLVVLVSTELWERIGRGAAALARTLEPPDSLELFNALLGSSDIDSFDAWSEKFRQRVEPLRPGQVTAWSQVFVSSYRQFEAKNSRPPLPGAGGDVAEIENTVRNAAFGWMDALTKWHIKPDRTSYDRNYLLLAAVYDGAPIEDVHRKIARLAQALGEKASQVVPSEGQQGPGLIQLAKQIDAELLPNGSLRFPGPGFAEAVVRYFWLDRPHLTEKFMKWTVQLSLELKQPQASQLADRMTPWILHHAQATNSTRLLRLVAGEWSEDRNLAADAHDLLVMASLDQQIGGISRKAITRWVEQPETRAGLLRTLARVFATLTPAHEQMLGRLGELAGSTEKGVPEAVGDAISDLWANDEYQASLRSTLTSWFGTEQEQLRRAATSAFLQLALQRDADENLTLLRELSTSNWVVRGWRAVLEEQQPGPLAHQAFMAWLDEAATSGASKEQIFPTLVDAVHDTPKDDLRGLRYLNLGRLGENWVFQSIVLDREERNKIRYELDRRTQLADPQRSFDRDSEDSPVA